MGLYKEISLRWGMQPDYDWIIPCQLHVAATYHGDVAWNRTDPISKWHHIKWPWPFLMTQQSPCAFIAVTISPRINPALYLKTLIIRSFRTLHFTQCEATLVKKWTTNPKFSTNYHHAFLKTRAQIYKKKIASWNNHKIVNKSEVNKYWICC